jgi:GNAT superfamily N-acetyltransferase
MIVRASRAGDAEAAAELAAARRARYEPYSPVFWRRAEDAVERHRPFLAHCLEDPGYTARTAEHEGRVVGIAIAGHRLLMPPFQDDPRASWLLDDLYLGDESSWPTVGAALVEAIAGEAAAVGVERLVVVSARADEPRRRALLDAGFAPAAEWHVLPVEPAPAEAELPEGVDAVVGPAPPVYDPGGPTALALRIAAPEVAAFSAWASASGAVVAIVPVGCTDAPLLAALATHGYAVASEWLARDL